MEGDLSVVEGEVMRIKALHDQDWVLVENSMGDSGLCPGNHLDPNPEFDGSVQFDIDRLLSYKQVWSLIIFFCFLLGGGHLVSL